MDTPIKKNKNEIESLKQQWVNDPIWDLENTEGFEAHGEELLAFRLKKEKEWLEQNSASHAAKQEARNLAVSKFCDDIGIADVKLGALLFVMNEKIEAQDVMLGMISDCVLELDSSLKKELGRNHVWSDLVQRVLQARQ